MKATVRWENVARHTNASRPSDDIVVARRPLGRRSNLLGEKHARRRAFYRHAALLHPAQCSTVAIRWETFRIVLPPCRAITARITPRQCLTSWWLRPAPAWRGHGTTPTQCRCADASPRILGRFILPHAYLSDSLKLILEVGYATALPTHC